MSNTDTIKTFAINVPSNEFRRDRILAQSSKSGVDVQIFDAITPDTMARIHHTYNEQKTRHFTGRGLMPTEKACALSHLQLWRQLQNDNDADYYLILEDDIDVIHNMGDIINALDLSKIDFLKLSGQQNRPMKKMRDVNDDFSLYRYAFGPLDAAAYLVSKKGAQKLEAYCQTLLSPIDILMDRSYDHGVPIYGVFPYAGSTQFNFESDDPLFTDIGVRDHKYAPDITKCEKLIVKYHRLVGSLKRHLATICLHLVKE
jgi:glycosyl transferase family 25